MTGTTKSAPPPDMVGRFLLPGPYDTLLLQVCLGRGEAVGIAFADWSRPVSRALSLLQTHGKRRLIPLLHAVLKREEILPPPELHTMLRAASLYEELRTREYQAIAKDVLKSLTHAEIPFLATRGVCFTGTLYGEAELRHCHDIDLLVPASRLGAAAEVLVQSCGFTASAQGPLDGSLVLSHSSGLPLALHTSAIEFPGFSLPWEELYRTRVPLHTDLTGAATFSPEYTLLQVILHGAAGPQRNNLVWLCDARKLIARNTVDWNRLFDVVASETVQLLVLLTVLNYLAEALDAPVPSDVRTRLRDRWNTAGHGERRYAQQVLLQGLLRSQSARSVLQEADTPVQRALLLLYLLFSAPKALCAARRIESPLDAPAYWAKRIFRRLGRTLHGRS